MHVKAETTYAREWIVVDDNGNLGLRQVPPIESAVPLVFRDGGGLRFVIKHDRVLLLRIAPGDDPNATMEAVGTIDREHVALVAEVLLGLLDPTKVDCNWQIDNLGDQLPSICTCEACRSEFSEDESGADIDDGLCPRCAEVRSGSMPELPEDSKI